MGFLKLFSRSRQSQLLRLPAGSFTLDKDGRIMTSTMPGSFPQHYLHTIGQHVLASLREARKAQIPLAELVVQFATLKVQARELRGGAIVFLAPSR